MKHISTCIASILLLLSCSKDSTDRFRWDRNPAGNGGTAWFVEVLTDTTLLTGGMSNGHPFAALTDDDGLLLWSWTDETVEGSLRDGMADTTGYYFAGSMDGKPAFFRLDSAGQLVTPMVYSDLLADRAMSIYSEGVNQYYLSTGSDFDTLEVPRRDGHILAVDTNGILVDRIDISNGVYMSVDGFDVDDRGRFLVALSYTVVSNRTSVMLRKYSIEGFKLWETELYNNPDYLSTAVHLEWGGDGYCYTTGRTERYSGGEVIGNSFLAKVAGQDGSVDWKVYPESSNAGTSVQLADNGDVYLLNRNCMIVNILSNDAGGETLERLRPFEVCDNYDTDQYGYDLAFSADGYLLVAGQGGGDYRLVKMDFTGTAVEEL